MCQRTSKSIPPSAEITLPWYPNRSSAPICLLSVRSFLAIDEKQAKWGSKIRTLFHNDPNNGSDQTLEMLLNKLQDYLSYFCDGSRHTNNFPVVTLKVGALLRNLNDQRLLPLIGIDLRFPWFRNKLNQWLQGRQGSGVEIKWVWGENYAGPTIIHFFIQTCFLGPRKNSGAWLYLFVTAACNMIQKSLI